MAKATYVIVRKCKLPSVMVDNTNPHNPNQISWKTFQKGDIINGELKHANNKPAFVLSNGIVVPLYCVKAVVTKEIVSSATGEEKAMEQNKKVIVETTAKVRYLDYAIVGALAGCGVVYFAQKKAWIKVPNKENYLYGAIAGALAGVYIIYRTRNTSKIKITKPE